MAKFVVWHERTQRIMTTVEAETREEAIDKYDEYADSKFANVDQRFDEADSTYGTFCEEYSSTDRLKELARAEGVNEILTLEEAIGMRRKKDLVTIMCYGKLETRDRNEALRFYRDCAQNSEGHERNRYFNVLIDLMDGKTECSDRNGDY